MASVNPAARSAIDCPSTSASTSFLSSASVATERRTSMSPLHQQRQYHLGAWHCGRSRTLVVDRRTSRVLHSTCSWRVTTYKLKKVKYVDLYSTSSRSASNALPLPVSRSWSPIANRQPGTSEHCETTWYGLVYHAICLLNSPGFHWVLIPA